VNWPEPILLDFYGTVVEEHDLTIDLLVTSEDARAYKPRPEPFHLALDLLGLAPARVLHVESLGRVVTLLG
jgi:beta-phosphoglucomutase-like phosphatase (HAD superfamily)